MTNTPITTPGTVRMLPMLEPLARNWWLILLRGVLAILFGLATLAWPGLTLVTLVLLYGAFAMVDGVLALAAAVMGGRPEPRWWLALVGVTGVGAGLLTLFWPGVTGLVLLMFIGVWAIVSGVLQIFGAIRLRKEIEGEWLLVASGIVSVLFGAIVIAQPDKGAMGVAFAIAVFAMLYGALLIGLSLKLRKLAAVRI